jgi:threonine aldolase
MYGTRFFASDNSAGVHPKVMEALAACNEGHSIAYGDDPVTRRAEAAVKGVFGEQAEVFFVYNGTGANVLALETCAASYEAVLCTDVSHINVDECGSPEKIGGFKLPALPSTDGKLSPESLEPHLGVVGVEHHSQPRVVSLTQATELGTVYSLDELRAITGFAHDNNMVVHMDGARIANAIVSLGVDPREAVTDAGVDVLSFGATKNGLMFGEAVVFLNPELARGVKFRRKQQMQLASKMRFIAAQFEAYLADALWLELARRANEMARRLADGISGLDGVEIIAPVQANGVFVRLPKEVIEPLRSAKYFYTWNAAENVVRWMASYDTTEEDIDFFLEAARTEVNKAKQNGRV